MCTLPLSRIAGSQRPSGRHSNNKLMMRRVAFGVWWRDRFQVTSTLNRTVQAPSLASICIRDITTARPMYMYACLIVINSSLYTPTRIIIQRHDNGSNQEKSSRRQLLATPPIPPSPRKELRTDADASCGDGVWETTDSLQPPQPAAIDSGGDG